MTLSTKRSANIDLIKVLAAFCVICMHVIDIPDLWPEYVSYYLASGAVPLLFMVNGYLLLNKKIISMNKQLKKAGITFLVIIAWCVLYAIYTFIISKEIVNPFWIAILSLIQKGPMWPFWFLASLTIIHLCLPLFHEKFKINKFAYRITICFVAICLLCDVSNYILSMGQHSLIQTHLPQTFRLWTYMAYFLLGGLLGKDNIKEMISKKVKLIWHTILLVLLSIGIVLFFVYVANHFFFSTYAEFYYDSLAMIVWLLVLFSWINRLSIDNNILKKIIFEFGANIFGVYAMHLQLLRISRKFFFDYRFHTYTLLLPIGVFLIAQVISSIMRRVPIIKKMITL